MYTPYLRGRKFDLEALEDLTFKASIYSSEMVIPIIEPVSFTKDCLQSYFRLVARSAPFILVYNPRTTESTGDDVEKKLINGTLDGYEGYYLAFLISQQTNLQQVKNFVAKFSDRKISFIHYSMPGQKDEVISFINSLTKIHHHIFLKSAFTKRYIDEVVNLESKKIVLADVFNKQITNSAYATNVTEFFTDAHKTYKKLGFDGFGDFSIMGEKFDDGKGIARAIVIHWPFINPDDGNIWINHFVSDNTIGTEDIGGKFDEAYKKLRAFCQNDSEHISTLGYYFISQYGDKGRLPQQGAIKKFSIMHHIELIRGLID